MTERFRSRLEGSEIRGLWLMIRVYRQRQNMECERPLQRKVNILDGSSVMDLS